jgi:hypothetical protein
VGQSWWLLRVVDAACAAGAGSAAGAGALDVPHAVLTIAMKAKHVMWRMGRHSTRVWLKPDTMILSA